MLDDRSFFELAAALLPALVFGGLLTDRLRPSPGASPWGVAAMFGGAQFILIAEYLAIQAAITGDPGQAHRIVVSTAVVGVTVLALGLLVQPWMKTLPAHARRAFAKLVWAGLLLSGALGVFIVERSVLSSTQQEEIERFNAVIPAYARATERQADLFRKEGRLLRRATRVRPSNRRERARVLREYKAIQREIELLDVQIDAFQSRLQP